MLRRRLQEFSQFEIKNEPMLFNCDMEHALELGGPITRDFLSTLPSSWHEVPVVVDTRVHMLMPGWYPCIPGYHHDDVPRTREDGQPNYDDPRRSEHIMALHNADICPTKFAIGATSFEHVPFGRVVYGQWHHEVLDKIKLGYLRELEVPDRELIAFNDRTWHAGQPAKAAGWRWFGRISRYYSKWMGEPIARGNERTNEVRKQVQVYLDTVDKGW